jgi:hypothetical protein
VTDIVDGGYIHGKASRAASPMFTNIISSVNVTDIVDGSNLNRTQYVDVLHRCCNVRIPEVRYTTFHMYSLNRGDQLKASM